MKLVVLDDYQGFARQFFEAEAPSDLEIVVLREHLAHDQLLPIILDADVILAMRERTPLSADFLIQLPNLKLVVTTGMRNDAVEVPPGVLLCGTRILPNPVVELTWGLILSLLRNIPREQSNLRQGFWQQEIGTTLLGKTLGVVGLGKSGAAVARIAQAFGMNVIAWSENLDPSHANQMQVTALGKQQLFEQADIVSVHLRLSERTTSIIGKPEFAVMKPSSYLVNTSRAQIVDTEALIKALQSQSIAGAALDVFDEEPLPSSSPLLGIKNLLLTPHIGFVVRENYELFFQDAIEDIMQFLAGDPVRVIQK